MASQSDRPEETPWDELEQGFFASAPPDVPEPAPEPMRFDDLDPVAPARPQRRSQAWRDAASETASAALRKLAPARASAAAAWRKVAPAVVAAAAVSRRSSQRLVTLAQAAARAQVPRVFAVFRSSSRQTRLLAAGIAALVAVTGVSAGVVASRGGGRSIAAAPAIASRAPVACPAPSPPVAMTVAPEEDPFPASASIATSVTTPAPRKRKPVKTPARSPVRAKALSKPPLGPIARPAR